MNNTQLTYRHQYINLNTMNFESLNYISDLLNTMGTDTEHIINLLIKNGFYPLDGHYYNGKDCMVYINRMLKSTKYINAVYIVKSNTGEAMFPQYPNETINEFVNRIQEYIK
jgi:hypothetical protein